MKLDETTMPEEVLEKTLDYQDSSVDSSNCLKEAMVLEQTIPSLASFPFLKRYSAQHEQLFNSLSHLIPALQECHENQLFRPLQVQDVLELGQKAGTEKDHKLKYIGPQLKNKKVAEEVVKIWNERHGRSTLG